jgi:Acyl-CoA dehydrogenase, N-terminal domain/Acyl-CoA dehydrogenase, middle domain
VVGRGEGEGHPGEDWKGRGEKEHADCWLRPNQSIGDMEFELTPEQEDLQKEAIEFARRELNSNMIERDAQQVFSHEGWKKCAAFGVHGMPIPKQYGGSSADAITTIATMEGLGYGGLDQGLLFAINAHMWTNSIPLLKYGTEEQKKRYLPGLCDGSLIGANGASEPDAGSDIFSMQTGVRKHGSDYVLNGKKIFVTNAPVADLFTIYATLDPQLGASGICALVVEKGTKGKTSSYSARHRWPNFCLKTAACQQQPCLGEKAMASRSSTVPWHGNELVSWPRALERCVASLNDALSTHASAGNSVSR